MPTFSEDGSSLCSSEASSQISDDYSSYNNRRKPVKQVTHIKVTNCAGPFVVGRKGKIEVAQPRDDNHLVLPSTSAAQASLPPDPSPSEVVDAVIDTGISEENISQFGENCQGSYCPVINCRQQCGTEKEPKWNARPSAGQGILFNKGGLEFQWSIKTFLENPEKFIQDMDINAGSLKEEKEDFILHKILPDLEESWGKCFSSNEEIYKILAKISCSGKSGKVVRQALQLLLHLICKDNFDSCNQNLLGVEAITRSSILSPDGLLKKDRHSERELKLYVYSRILSSLVIQQVRQGELPIVAALEQDLKKLQDELKRFSNQLNTKKKDGVRYSMEFILKAISYLLKPHDKLKGFLDECQEFCLNQEINSNELKVLRKLKKNGEWIDLHCILIHLHGKVHSERPKPRMETERRAMMLLRLLVETYLEGGGGDDWRFCLLAASILSDIGMNSATKEMRQEAGGCLVNLLKDANVQKRPECRACLERRSSEVLFCPDRVTKTILVHFLSKNQNLQHELPADLLIEHLSSKYRTQTLEINKTTISQSLSCFVNHGMFQRKKVAVKVLFVKKKHLLEEDPIFHAKERLIREADNLRRLNQSHHANIPVLLSYDTKSLPYHLITAFERWGDLLQFVRRSRERRPHLKPIQLLEMLIDIANALLYLEKEGLVHRAVMATNVLVGNNYDCKLSGMHSLQQLTNQTENSDSLYSYCSVDDGWPEFISKTNDEELPVRWKAPECLLEHRYTTASDVWAFGVLMYEVLTYGCLPYRHVLNDDEVSFRVMDADGKEALPFESCFEEKEHELMMQCCERQRYIRLKLSEVKAKLSEMHENADEQQSRPDPPSLDMHVTYESYELGNSKETYDSISGSVYNECSFQFNREMVEGVSVVSEKITRGDVQHLRKLLALNHPNLVSIWKIDNLDSHCPTVDVISKEASLGNLKEYVLDRQCQKENIVTYLSQVASALHYLHVNHIVHGDLSAEYVNVLAPDKVQVGHLSLSKALSMSAYEFTSTSCVVKAAIPPASTRWSAPEVILDGHYTHASDVWAFGILAWELYKSFTTGQDGRPLSVPFYNLDNHEILSHIRGIGPLPQPDGCPDWMYIIMHQCWAYDSRQRPPFLAIFDCLTNREPMKSWIMTLWLLNHDKSEWPDLSISQTEGACHVTAAEQHPKREVIEKMCSEDFFGKHNYKYIETTSDIAGDVEFGEDELYAYSSYSKASNSDVNENLDSSSEYEAICISCNEVGEDNKPMTRNAALGEPGDNESGYLCPVAMEVEERSDIEHHSRNQDTTDAVGRKRSHTEIYQAEAVSRPSNEDTDSKVITNVKKRVVEHKTSAFSLDQDEGSLGFEEHQHMAYKLPDRHNDPQDEDMGFEGYQNVAYKLDQHNDSLDEDTNFVEYQNMKLDQESIDKDTGSILTTDAPSLVEYQNLELHQNDGSMDEETMGCSYGNILPLGLSTGEMNNTLYSHVNKIKKKCQLENKETVYANIINWVSDQMVPQSDHLYANVQEKADEPDCDSASRVTMETGQVHMEADYRTISVYVGVF